MWKKLKAFYQARRWECWAALAAISGLVLLALRLLVFRGGPEHSGDETYLPEPPKFLVRKVKQVEKEALVARVEARVKAEEDKKELEVVASLEDEVERRKRLAEMLRRL
jgi:hypothetical protein